MLKHMKTNKNNKNDNHDSDNNPPTHRLSSVLEVIPPKTQTTQHPESKLPQIQTSQHHTPNFQLLPPPASRCPKPRTRSSDPGVSVLRRINKNI